MILIGSQFYRYSLLWRQVFRVSFSAQAAKETNQNLTTLELTDMFLFPLKMQVEAGTK